MSRTATRGSAGAADREDDARDDADLDAFNRYLAASERPLVSLAFVIPLIILYELGTLKYASDPVRHTEQRIIAFNMMRSLFDACGAHARYLPAFAVPCILLFWHLARRDPWKVPVSAVGGIVVESIILALPLVALGEVLRHHLPLAEVDGRPPWKAMVVLSLGAGVYEELVFRLMAFVLLSLLLIDLLKMERKRAGILIIVLSAVLFSLYHNFRLDRLAYHTLTLHWSQLTAANLLTTDPFSFGAFVFRTAAGVYFGVLFLSRGFGITVGTHAIYDLIIVICEYKLLF